MNLVNFFILFFLNFLSMQQQTNSNQIVMVDATKDPIVFKSPLDIIKIFLSYPLPKTLSNISYSVCNTNFLLLANRFEFKFDEQEVKKYFEEIFFLDDVNNQNSLVTQKDKERMHNVFLLSRILFDLIVKYDVNVDYIKSNLGFNINESEQAAKLRQKEEERLMKENKERLSQCILFKKTLDVFFYRAIELCKKNNINPSGFTVFMDKFILLEDERSIIMNLQSANNNLSIISNSNQQAFNNLQFQYNQLCKSYLSLYDFYKIELNNINLLSSQNANLLNQVILLSGKLQSFKCDKCESFINENIQLKNQLQNYCTENSRISLYNELIKKNKELEEQATIFSEKQKNFVIENEQLKLKENQLNDLKNKIQEQENLKIENANILRSNRNFKYLSLALGGGLSIFIAIYFFEKSKKKIQVL
jgi:hypothetical protein